ncbi:beta-lactamase domain protein [Desulfovibrio sp. X2]|uniref:MBL fold metallo-hydrolase n=1 Tax=Desulfovibrio sp. X2 TaxID=941449 RepID=UPI00035886BA|nr:MBL fold metallo-hydrolase [Desulfovibrio sp. X2]EPR37593.1 beta-lactamase domain protein [Desulfovibrio sp. X2]
MILHSFILGPLANNCYVIADKATRTASVIDPGLAPESVVEYLRRFGFSLESILLTHLHVDHVLGVADLLDACGADGTAVLASDKDLAIGDEPLTRGGKWGLPRVRDFDFTPLAPGRLTVLGQPCLAIEVPGHSPGSLCFYFPAMESLFTGDTLFRGTVGRTDHAFGDGDLLVRTIAERLFLLPDATEVYPGHGRETTIAREKERNRFFAATRAG